MWSVWVATGLALVACASSDKKKEPAPEERPASAFEILTERGWGLDMLKDDQLAFMEDGKFVWHRTTPCGKPPCPSERLAGTWKIEHDTQIYMTPDGGELEIYDFEFGASSTNSLYLKAKGGKVHEFHRAAAIPPR